MKKGLSKRTYNEFNKISIGWVLWKLKMSYFKSCEGLREALDDESY